LNKNNSLKEWLYWIKSNHPKHMDLSLERVRSVGGKLGVLVSDSVVVTVAGTNGKGSTVSGLEAVYLDNGLKVGAFTSPYLFNFNEQIRVNGKEISDSYIVEAFDLIKKQLNEDLTLTIFEFTALAAFYIFKKLNLDVWILEVGLGGRFDAVNAIDTDLAIITSIGIDHTEWLGNTREEIGFEKAGVFRLGVPIVCGDPNPPESILNAAKELRAPLYLQNKDFTSRTKGDAFSFVSKGLELDDLPMPNILLQNVSTVLMALEINKSKLSFSVQKLKNSLQKITLKGRMQIAQGDVTKIYDVSHNPASVSILANYLQNNPSKGKTFAVFSMLQDKDISSCLNLVKNFVDDWYISELKVERHAKLKNISNALQKIGVQNINVYPTVKQAYKAVNNLTNTGDRVVVFGSFSTISEVLL